jgi:hypothetical protein
MTAIIGFMLKSKEMKLKSAMQSFMKIPAAYQIPGK